MVDITRGSKAESFTRVKIGFLSNDGGKVYHGGNDDPALFSAAPTLCPTGTNNLLTDGTLKVDSTNNGNVITYSTLTADNGLQYKFDNQGSIFEVDTKAGTSKDITNDFVSEGDCSGWLGDCSDKVIKLPNSAYTIYRSDGGFGEPDSYVVATPEYAVGIENEASDEEFDKDSQQVEVTATGKNSNSIDPTGLLAKALIDNVYNNKEDLNEFDIP